VAKDLGVSFAFPTQTLHVDSMAGQGQRFEPSVPSNGDLENLVSSYALGGGKAITPGPRLGKSYYFNE
jgi:hypothetical protein